MDQKHIAAQLYTLRDFLATPADIEKTLRRVRKIGYPAIQISGLGPFDPQFMADLTRELDLTVCVTHVPPDRLLHDLPAVIREHRLWNCEYIGIGSMPDAYRGSRDGVLRFAQEFNVVGRKLLAEGLKFVYHNHHFEFAKYDGVTGMDLLFDAADPKAFGFLLDTYWLQVAGADPVKWIRKAAGRVGPIHLKDVAVRNGETVYGEIGEGNLDWDGILAACRETGVKWYAVEEDDCPGNPFDSLARSLAYLQRFL